MSNLEFKLGEIVDVFIHFDVDRYVPCKIVDFDTEDEEFLVEPLEDLTGIIVPEHKRYAEEGTHWTHFSWCRKAKPMVTLDEDLFIV